MRGVAFRSLTEAIDTTNSHGAFLFNLFGTLAEYERVLITERVNAGLAAARRRGRKGGRPPTIDTEKVEQILAALEAGASKASVCRTFKVPRSTLIDTLRRTGWTGPGKEDEPAPQFESGCDRWPSSTRSRAPFCSTHPMFMKRPSRAMRCPLRTSLSPGRIADRIIVWVLPSNSPWCVISVVRSALGSSASGSRLRCRRPVGHRRCGVRTLCPAGGNPSRTYAGDCRRTGSPARPGERLSIPDHRGGTRGSRYRTRRADHQGRDRSPEGEEAARSCAGTADTSGDGGPGGSATTGLSRLDPGHGATVHRGA